MNINANLNATVGIFFDSFAKIAISVAVLTGTIKLSTTTVYYQIIPGVCTGIFLLNLAYFWQARHLSLATNRQVTALPSGLQSSCVFVWLFAIMLPITVRTHNALLAYQVALLANLINAIVFIIAGLLLVKIKRYIPNPALFSGLAGSAFTWLAVNNLPLLFAHPLSGLLPMLIILAMIIARINLKLPIVAIGVICGTIIAFLTHEFNWNFIRTSDPSLIFSTPQVIFLNLSVPVMNACLAYLPLIIAFALIDAISAVQILEEAQLSNDNFKQQQTILISGIISGASSFIGNPFAMALFFGHYSWKQSGADYKYSLYNGIIYLILGISGLAAFCISLVPDWVTLPILIIIGINTTAISFAGLVKKEYILLVIGMIPMLSELIYNKLELMALENNFSNFIHNTQIAGLFTLAKGSILFSLLLTTLFYYVMYHKWFAATISCLLLSFFTTFGFIHSQNPGFYFFTQINYTYLSGAILCLIMSLTRGLKW